MPREKFKTLTEQMFYVLLCLLEQGWLIENMGNPFLWRYRRIEPRTLSFALVYSPHMLPLVLADLFLFFYVGYLLWSDIHWYRHAAKAADTGIFMPITHKRFSASRLALFIIAFVILLHTLSLCR